MKKIILLFLIMCTNYAYSGVYEVSSISESIMALPGIPKYSACIPNKHATFRSLYELSQAGSSNLKMANTLHKLKGMDLSKSLVVMPKNKEGEERCVFTLQGGGKVEAVLRFKARAKSPLVTLGKKFGASSEKLATPEKSSSFSDALLIGEYFENQLPSGFTVVHSLQAKPLVMLRKDTGKKHDYRIISVITNGFDTNIAEIIIPERLNSYENKIDDLGVLYAHTILTGKKGSRLIISYSNKVTIDELIGYLK
ncbi:hypothetical protein [Halobacteriovorax sp. CON-3]|uniref:hypothetical protein n=1 Tax=Halobacteriovorax sp. CON-3 TaxID=3157710 RepID=UPI00372154C1